MGCGSGGGSGAASSASGTTSSTGASAGGWGEGGGGTEWRIIGAGNKGSESSESLVTSGGWVDGTEHAQFAVAGMGAEVPDGSGGLGYFEGEDTNLSSSGIERHEWRGKAILLGNGVELLSAGVCEGALGNGVVTSSELEIDKVANVSSDDLGVKNRSRCAILTHSDEYGDVSGESRGSSDEGSKSSSGELHD